MTIYIQYSACGDHIRKWSREPFDGGVAYVEAPGERAAIVRYLRETASILDSETDQPRKAAHHADACRHAAVAIELGEHLLPAPRAEGGE